MTLPSSWKDAAFWSSVIAAGIGSALLQPEPSPLWRLVGAASVAMLPLIFAGVRHSENKAKIEAHETDIETLKKEP